MRMIRNHGRAPSLPDLPTARVGWFETAKYEDGTPVAAVAAKNEFGSGPVPARPFMRPTIEAELPQWARIAERAAKQVVAGAMDQRTAIEVLAAKAAGDIRKAITRVQSPPLAPRTIEARAARGASGKASAKPLVDTGHMLQTLTHEVQL